MSAAASSGVGSATGSTSGSAEKRATSFAIGLSFHSVATGLARLSRPASHSASAALWPPDSPSTPGSTPAASNSDRKQLGRDHDRTPVTHPHPICRLLLEK